MKKTLLLLLLIPLFGHGQQTYFTPGIPTGSTSLTPSFRYIGIDSLVKLYIGNSNRWSQVYTATQSNARFPAKGVKSSTNYGAFFNSNGQLVEIPGFTTDSATFFAFNKPLFYNATVPYYYGNQHIVKIPGGELGIDSVSYVPMKKLYSLSTPNFVGDTTNGTAIADIEPVNHSAQLSVTDGSTQSALSLSLAESHLNFNGDGYGIKSISLGPGLIPIYIDNPTHQGAAYLTPPNYQVGNYLATTAQLDSVVSGGGVKPTNGLQSIAPDSIGLGGSLTQSTTINTGSFLPIKIGDNDNNTASLNILPDTLGPQVNLRATDKLGVNNSRIGLSINGVSNTYQGSNGTDNIVGVDKDGFHVNNVDSTGTKQKIFTIAASIRGLQVLDATNIGLIDSLHHVITDGRQYAEIQDVDSIAKAKSDSVFTGGTAGFELLSNKATSLLTLNNTLYPTTKAVAGYYDKVFALDTTITIPVINVTGGGLTATSRFTVKGNDTTATNYVTASLDGQGRVIQDLSNNGRMDITSYSQIFNPIITLRNFSPAFAGQTIAHLGAIANNASGNANTVAYMGYVKVLNPLQTNYSSSIQLGWDDNQNQAPGGIVTYQQPNRSVVFGNNQVVFPSIPVGGMSTLKAIRDTVTKIIGGTGTTQTLTFQPTSGVGASGADMIFDVGNNGGTEAMRIFNSARVGIGTSTDDGLNALHVTGLSTFVGNDNTFGSSVGKVHIGNGAISYNRNTATGVIDNNGSMAIQTNYTNSATPTSFFRAEQIYNGSGTSVTATSQVLNGAGYYGEGANSLTSWHLFHASTAAASTLNIPTGTAPTTPVSGDLYRPSASVLNFYDGTTAQTLAFLNSPTFTGTPAAPTAPVGTNTTQIATTAFVKAAGAIHGNSTTTGTATTAVTVTIGQTMANSTYYVDVSPQNLLTAVNWYISAKTTTTFTVTFVSALTGSINFDWNINP